MNKGKKQLAAILVTCLVTAAPALGQAASEQGTAVSEMVRQTAVYQRTLPGRPDFAESLPGKVNEKAIREVNWRLSPAYSEPYLAPAAAPETVAVMGEATATQEQMVRFILRRNPKPKLQCSVEDIVKAYYEEAGREGIRPDVALCQALKETGFFAYGGDVSPEQNNFCGLGATGNHEPGASFARPQLGVRAHIQHLLAYAGQEEPKAAIVDPRYELIVRYHPEIHGQIRVWTGLNGVWAVPGKTYGQDILRLWQQAQAPDGSDTSLSAAQARVTAHPEAVDAYIYRGIVLGYRGDAKQAVKDFQKAIRLDETSAEARYDLALMMEKQGKIKDALKCYNALLEKHPDFMAAWYNRGLLHLAMKKNGEALRDFKQVLGMNPESAAAANGIGVAHIREKHYAEAWQDFRDAAARNSANMDVLGNQFIFAACIQETDKR